MHTSITKIIENLEDYTLSSKSTYQSKNSLKHYSLSNITHKRLVKLANKLKTSTLNVLIAVLQLYIHYETEQPIIIVSRLKTPDTMLQIHPLCSVMMRVRSLKSQIDYLKTIKSRKISFKTTKPIIYKYLVTDKMCNMKEFSIQHYTELLFRLTENKLFLYYQAALFDRKQIKKFDKRFNKLLQEYNKDINTNLYQLNLLTPRENNLLTRYKNSSAYDQNICLPEQFNQQRKKTPRALALIFNNEQYTYAQLDEEANKVAYHLIGLKIGREDKVAVCLERNCHLIFALLGILKVGAAYIPLDPAYPPDRLVYMLEDAKPSCIIADPHTLQKLPSLSKDIQYLNIKQLCDANDPIKLPRIKILPHQLSHILYTSGSTGMPKGVAITHRSVNALLHWAKLIYKPHELKRVLAGTSICFDLSVFEIFLPLTVGGCVVLVTNPLHRVEWKKHEVSLINTVPAVSKVLIAAGLPKSLRTINLAGEPLQPTLAKEIYQVDHVKKLYNLYGPTEDTTYSTYSLIKRHGIKLITIGIPIKNSQSYILNKYLQPVSVCEVGELYLAGEGLARGYLNRPDLTASRFIPNPFNKNNHDRMYKTGDLCKILPSGEIEYLGRIDHQIKIRGFRVELGEIENILTAHAKIKDAVVIMKDDKMGNKNLIAYVTSKANNFETIDKSAIIKELKEKLYKKLPHYMQPRDIILLEALPHNPNGKIDRIKLLAMIPDTPTLSLEQLPRNFIEYELFHLWVDILGYNTFSIDDNFFALGGNSIQAALLATSIQEKLKVDFTINNITQMPTINLMAEYIEKYAATNIESPIIALQKKGDKPPLFCIHPVGGGILVYSRLALLLGDAQPFYAITQLRVAETNFEEMAARYIKYIKEIQPKGPYRVCGWSTGGLLAYEITHQLEKANNAVEFLGIFDTDLPNASALATRADYIGLLKRLANNLSQVHQVEINLDGQRINQLSLQELPDYFYQYVTNILFANKMELAESESAEIKRLLSCALVNFVAEEKYEMKKIKSPIYLFETMEGKEQIKAEGFKQLSDKWLPFTANKVKVSFIEGDHFSLMDFPYVQQLAKAMVIRLNELD